MPKTKNLVFAFAGCIATLLLCALFLFACKNENAPVRVGSLNGPTSIGLSEMPQEGYEFSKVNQPDALVSDIAAGNVDIALVPINLAANLYNKTSGDIYVVNINTLNVLKIVSQSQNISSIKGKTIYSAGKGTVVESNIILWLKSMGLSENDVNHKFKSDANEVISYLLQDPNAIGIVNEPVASSAIHKYNNLFISDGFEDAIKKAYGDNAEPITGVTIVRKSFLDNNKSLVGKFLLDHKNSVEKSLKNNEEAKNCNITFIVGKEMNEKIKNSLNVILETNPKLVGNKLPDDNFYYYDE